MSKEELKDVLIASIVLWVLLYLMTGCSNISVEHEHGKMPKLDFKSKTIDSFCTKDFDADIKSDQFIISCDIAL